MTDSKYKTVAKEYTKESKDGTKKYKIKVLDKEVDIDKKAYNEKKEGVEVKIKVDVIELDKDGKETSTKHEGKDVKCKVIKGTFSDSVEIPANMEIANVLELKEKFQTPMAG